MVGGEALQITLTTGMLEHVSQINTQRICIHIFHTIKASSGEYRHISYPISKQALDLITIVFILLFYVFSWWCLILWNICIQILWLFICETWPTISVVRVMVKNDFSFILGLPLIKANQWDVWFFFQSVNNLICHWIFWFETGRFTYECWTNVGFDQPELGIIHFIR